MNKVEVGQVWEFNSYKYKILGISNQGTNSELVTYKEFNESLNIQVGIFTSTRSEFLAKFDAV
jgi:hypothetical protein